MLRHADDVKGQAASGSNREGESTEARRRGGAARSSVEGSVMGLERRGCVVRPRPLANWKQEEPVDEAKPFKQRSNIGSRVTREGHARIWERPEVKFLRATRRVSRAPYELSAARNCTRDEGGPFGFGDQEPISSHRKPLRAKAVVVSVAETPGPDFGRHGRERRAQANRCRSVESGLGDVRTRG